MRGRAIGISALVGAGVEFLFSIVGIALGDLPRWAVVSHLLLSPFSIGWAAFKEGASFYDRETLVFLAWIVAINAALYALVATVIWLIGPWGSAAQREEVS